MIVAFPLLAGGTHAIVACESAAWAITPVGAPGTVMASGITELLGADKELLPCALVARTSN